MSATLIIGGDGKVGRALAEHLAQAGETVITTSRRPDPGTGVLPLDLAGAVESWPIPAGVAVAVVCAAVPLIDACEKDPVGTGRVNVSGTLTLIRRLATQGIFTIFLSTNQVFDGETPFMLPETPQSPRSEYGRQKTHVEQELRSLGERVAIVRFTKILEPVVSLFAKWRDALRAGEPITPFSDMRMAPVPLSSAVSALRLIADRRAPGFWQVSGERDITYSDAALLLALHLKADPALVQSIAARTSGRVTAHLPSHTTLCVDRLRRELGLQPPPVDWTIVSALRAQG